MKINEIFALVFAAIASAAVIVCLFGAVMHNLVAFAVASIFACFAASMLVFNKIANYEH